MEAATKTLELQKEKLNLITLALANSKRALEEMDDFVKRVVPTLPELPRPGQWFPETLTLIVNGHEFVRCDIKKRLKRFSPSVVLFWESISPEEQFVHGLRVNINTRSKKSDELLASFTTLFKVTGVSGWEEQIPVPTAQVVGVLRHNPSEGADGFVSLDLELESVEVNGKTFVLDGTQGVSHRRYIRVEHRHQPPGGTDDVRYKNWQPGTKLRVRGTVKRDLDRATFYEIHPQAAADINVLP